MRQPPIGAHSAACVATKPEMPSSREGSSGRTTGSSGRRDDGQVHVEVEGLIPVHVSQVRVKGRDEGEHVVGICVNESARWMTRVQEEGGIQWADWQQDEDSESR